VQVTGACGRSVEKDREKAAPLLLRLPHKLPCSSVKAISNHAEPVFNGLYAHWFSAVKYDMEKQLHHYHDLVALTHDDELHSGTAYTQIVYHEKPFIARSWQTAVVMELMQTAGFEYVGNKWNMDCRFMPFKKVKNKDDIDYLGG